MRTNQAGLDLIKSFEGLRLRSYICPGGKPTIGYGHTGDEVKLNQTITKERAEELLKQDLQRFERAVSTLITASISENQFAALVSFTFNCGDTALSRSSLRRRLNQGDYAGAANEFLKWVNANGRMLEGLKRRREAERKLFLTP